MFSVAELFSQTKTGAIKWSIAGEMPPAQGQINSLGVAGPVAGVHGNKMFVAGGANFPDSMPWQGGKKKYYSDIYVYKKIGSRFTRLTIELKLPEKIAYSANCSTPKGLVYAGGENEAGISDKVFLIQWDNEIKSAVVKNLPKLPVAITNASATADNNIVYVAGGESIDSVSDKCWSIDLNNTGKGWKELASVPKPVSHAVLVAPQVNGILKLYLFGGRRKTPQGISELYNSVYEYNTLKNQWNELDPLPYTLSAGTGIAAGSAGIVLFGGDRGIIFGKVENFNADISKANTESERKQLTQQKILLIEAHPGFSKEVLLYNINTGKCKTAGTIPFPVPVTTTAFWWDNIAVIPSGEIRAGIRTSQILIAKIKRWLK